MKALILVILFTATTVYGACKMSRPHSFDCQHETFSGKIFPLRPLNFDILNENWWTNQYTAPTSRGAEFSNITSQSNSNRTCALLNTDRTRVGNLKFRMGQRTIKSVKIDQFRASGRTFLSNSKVSFENEHTIVFAGGNESFRCRIFMRVSIEHLSCQYFVDGQFRGYLGMLPFQTTCR